MLFYSALKISISLEAGGWKRKKVGYVVKALIMLETIVLLDLKLIISDVMLYKCNVHIYDFFFVSMLFVFRKVTSQPFPGFLEIGASGILFVVWRCWLKGRPSSCGGKGYSW